LKLDTFCHLNLMIIKDINFFKNVEIIIYRMNLNNLISPNENKDKDKDKDKNKNKNSEIFMSIKNQLNSK